MARAPRAAAHASTQLVCMEGEGDEDVKRSTRSRLAHPQRLPLNRSTSKARAEDFKRQHKCDDTIERRSTCIDSNGRVS